MYYKVVVLKDEEEINSQSFVRLQEALDFVLDKTYNVPKEYNVCVGVHNKGNLIDSWDYYKK